MKEYELIHYQMNVGETKKFRQIKTTLGAKTNTEVFRALLNRYPGMEDD